jgi:hypothetical protein
MAKPKSPQLSLETEILAPGPRLSKPARAPVSRPNGSRPAVAAPSSKPAEPAPLKPAEPAAAPAASEPARVAELVNGRDGCWKRLTTGENVPLSETEWRLELSRLIAGKPAPEGAAARPARGERP